MFTLENLKSYIETAKKLKINGLYYELWLDESPAGDQAVWSSDLFEIRATPMFDNVSIPVEIGDMDYNIIGTDAFYGDVSSFEEYRAKVKEMAEKIFSENNM